MTDTRNNGGPAFPHDKYMKREDGQFGTFAHGGMSLRDWFAGQAMAALIIANGGHSCALGLGSAKDAYSAADAMLAARSPSSKEA